MDKRKVWREQEQQLVERWKAASDRYRDAQTEISRGHPLEGDAVSAEDPVIRARTARAELEAMRKQIARLKAEFSNGKRY
ncbi:MAG TPA: hypothetical protein VIW78_08175 [Burkholderiales bacterium]